MPAPVGAAAGAACCGADCGGLSLAPVVAPLGAGLARRRRTCRRFPLRGGGGLLGRRAASERLGVRAYGPARPVPGAAAPAYGAVGGCAYAARRRRLGTARPRTAAPAVFAARRAAWAGGGGRRFAARFLLLLLFLLLLRVRLAADICATVMARPVGAACTGIIVAAANSALLASKSDFIDVMDDYSGGVVGRE